MNVVASAFSISGPLTASEIPSWRAQWMDGRQLSGSIDLSQVTRTDSSALAWLLELKATATDQSITFINPPRALLTLADLSGVTALLGWDNEQGNSI